MRKTSLIIMGLISLLGASATLASESSDANTGLYVGAAISTSIVHVPAGTALDGWMDTLGHFIYVPVLGYRFNQHFAIEANYMSLADDYRAGDESDGSDRYRLWTANLALKALLPLTNSGWSLYGKGGFAVTHQDVYNYWFSDDTTPLIDSNTTRLQPLVGFGAMYNFTNSVAIDLGYTHQFQNGVTPQIGSVAVGIDYTF